ncbi:MAG: superoxide dismutase family protein [Deltaproteobacteria bacterium]|nr:superoxide dismutase family protein [Deltaproteobacteria bacterium]
MSISRPVSLSLGLCALLLLALAPFARGAGLSADMYLATKDGQGGKVGTATFTDNGDGLDVMVDFMGLPPGQHGLHVHENPDCAPTTKDGQVTPAGAAGGHFDPDKTGKHLGPNGGGHKGDLPFITAAADGTAKATLHVKGVKSADFASRSLMIHAGGDNYSDTPASLGGGGARFACGLIR